jgi:3-oxoacyl-[acyl-carrier-protein] synthase-3
MDAYIKGISYYLPDKVVTNDDLVKDYPQWDAEKVANKVGVNERHVATDNETAGDMAVKASKQLFSEYSINMNSIDFILLCTQSPDYHLPSTACIVQDKLGIPTSAGALDFNLGCSGFEYGLALAKGLIVGGMAKNVLLLTTETYNKYIHPSDYGNRSIFGDGAAATLVSIEGEYKIGEFVFGTDGKGAESLIVHTGCARQPEKSGEVGKDDGGYINAPDYLYMNGTEIFNFTLEAVPAMVSELFKKNGITDEDVDEYIFHQANKFMLNTIRKICHFSKDKFYVNLEHTGNTVSSTIPIALKDYLANGGDAKSIMLAGFGVGLSWAGCLITKKIIYDRY